MNWINRRKPLARKGIERSKYGNSTSKGSDGRTYHSKLEASVNEILLLRERAGEIKILKRQQHIHYYAHGVKLCEYWPDFTCAFTDSGEVFWVEAKGKSDNADWRIKLNLWRAGGPGRLEIWGGTHIRPSLSETVQPQEHSALVREEQVFARLELPEAE